MQQRICHCPTTENSEFPCFDRARSLIHSKPLNSTAWRADGCNTRPVPSGIGADLEKLYVLVYGGSMRRRGMHTTPGLYLKAATVIVTVLFFLQGTGVSFSSAMPETKSRTAVFKCPFAKAQCEIKKILKLVALPNGSTCFNTAVAVSSIVSSRSFSGILHFPATVPARGPPAVTPSTIPA